MSSSHQIDLPFERPATRTHKHQRKRGAARRRSDVSVDAFEAIKHRRSRLYLPILLYLSECGPRPSDCPTARGILRGLIGRGVLPPNSERNTISPRLCELLQAGCVENPLDPDTGEVYRKKTAGDASASAWRVLPRGLLLIDELRRQQAAVQQNRPRRISARAC